MYGNISMRSKFFMLSEEELPSPTYVPIHTGATSEDQVNII